MNYFTSTLSKPYFFKKEAISVGYKFMYPDHEGILSECEIIGKDYTDDKGCITYKCKSKSKVKTMDCNWIEKLTNIFYLKDSEISNYDL